MAELMAPSSEATAYCTFRADERLFGIDVAWLREISTNTSITPVPPAPPALRGLANLRSRVHLVLDLRPLLGLPTANCTAESRLIILKPAVAEDVGLLVDRGGDIVRVSREQIESLDTASISGREPSGLSKSAAADFVVGVAKLDRELMMIIDAKRLVRAISSAMR